jgi:hypothetical protein
MHLNLIKGDPRQKTVLDQTRKVFKVKTRFSTYKSCKSKTRSTFLVEEKKLATFLLIEY